VVRKLIKQDLEPLIAEIDSLYIQLTTLVEPWYTKPTFREIDA
jgi:hypothetical protein